MIVPEPSSLLQPLVISPELIETVRRQVAKQVEGVPVAGNGLGVVADMAQRFDCPIGLSDHTPGVGAAIACGSQK